MVLAFLVGAENFGAVGLWNCARQISVLCMKLPEAIHYVFPFTDIRPTMIAFTRSMHRRSTFHNIASEVSRISCSPMCFSLQVHTHF